MYEVLEHTTDVRLRVIAPTREQLFAESAAALFHAMKAEANEELEPTREAIVLDAPDVTALLVDFLGEILLRAHINQRAYEVESFSTVDGTHLEGVLVSRPAAFDEDVKAVTYHEADVRETDAGWMTNLILDI